MRGIDPPHLVRVDMARHEIATTNTVEATNPPGAWKVPISVSKGTAMSRLTTLTCSLLIAVSSLVPAAAVAKRMNPASGGFAQPPPTVVASNAAQANVDEPSVAFAPRRALHRDDVRAALVQARARNLAAFRAYQ